MSGDWMALAFERFQHAARSVRLTTPPGRHEQFWQRLVELARLKNNGLTITILLTGDPAHPKALRAALRAIPILEHLGHEVGWCAAEPLPYSLVVLDDAWALIIAGDPDSPDNASYTRLTDDPEETRRLREAFDRRVTQGTWGIDPDEWLEWLDEVPHRKKTRTALAALHRGESRLDKAVQRALRTLPRRGFWLIKPHDSVYGMGDTTASHWAEWVLEGRVAMGWPELANGLAGVKFPRREAFHRLMRRHYPSYKDVDRAYATARHFIEDMNPHDRVAAVDGWTSKQTAPVRFHGWTRVEGEVYLDTYAKSWPLSREAEWNRYEVAIPVTAMRDVTGLGSCTYPIHNLSGPTFRNLIALAEEVKRRVGETQIALDLTLMNNNSGQQELL